MNYLTATGNVARDAELKYTPNGNAVLDFSVGTSVGRGDDKHTLWLNCSIWGKRGEALEMYVTKGTPVTIIGELDQRLWEKGEKPGAALEVNVREIALQGGGQKKDKPQQQGFRDAPAEPAPMADDPIPF